MEQNEPCSLLILYMNIHTEYAPADILQGKCFRSVTKLDLHWCVFSVCGSAALYAFFVRGHDVIKCECALGLVFLHLRGLKSKTPIKRESSQLFVMNLEMFYFQSWNWVICYPHSCDGCSKVWEAYNLNGRTIQYDNKCMLRCRGCRG